MSPIKHPQSVVTVPLMKNLNPPSAIIYNISVIEETAPAIIVLQTFDSPNLSPPALSDGQQSPCSQSKHGCFRLQRKVLYLLKF